MNGFGDGSVSDSSPFPFFRAALTGFGCES